MPSLLLGKLCWTSLSQDYSHQIRVVKLVVHAQECYTLVRFGGMLPQKNVEIEGL